MPIETEAKMRLDDRVGMEGRLAALGAAHVADMLECNTYFETPDGDLGAAGCVLRVRVVRVGDTKQTIITHKGPKLKGPFKSRDENELVVADAPQAHALLKALGYEPKLIFEKRRARYKLDACLIEFDDLPVLGSFIEIEGPSDSTVAAARAALQLDTQPLVEAGYSAMVAAYLSKQGGGATALRFGVL